MHLRHASWEESLGRPHYLGLTIPQKALIPLLGISGNRGKRAIPLPQQGHICTRTQEEMNGQVLLETKIGGCS